MSEFDIDGFQKDVGERMAFWRKKAELTQAEAAERIGMNRASYANIESGRQRVALDVVWRAAIIFKIRIERLTPERMAGGAQLMSTAWYLEFLGDGPLRAGSRT